MKLNKRIKNSTFASDLDGDELWFPIRSSGDDSHEFIVMEEWGADYDHAQRRVRDTNATIPQWDRANPVVRIQRVKLIAVMV